VNNKGKVDSIIFVIIVYPFAAALNAKKGNRTHLRECDCPKTRDPANGPVPYISTINLLVSSFQVTTRYQVIMARATRARVPPYPRKVSGR